MKKSILLLGRPCRGRVLKADHDRQSVGLMFWCERFGQVVYSANMPVYSYAPQDMLHIADTD